MTIKELKEHELYCFNCYIDKTKFEDYVKYCEIFDTWDCAYVSIGDEIGVEYNFYVDNTTNETWNCSAIYKTDYNKEEYCFSTDTDTYIHYEINFDNENWMEELENAMCEALIKFFNL